MSIPRKHHYIPAFYLERWENEKGKIIEFKILHCPHRKIIFKEIGKDATGWTRDLYTATNSDPFKSQKLELRFFAPLDGDASAIIRKIEQQQTVLTDLEKLRWAQFMLSLSARLPEDVAILKKWVAEEWKADASLTSRTANELENIALDVLVTICCEPSALDFIIGMKWCVLNIHVDNGLLLSDRPLVMTNGLNKQESYLMIPISPSTLFVATNNLEMMKTLAKNPALGDQINTTIVRHAARLAWSSSKKAYGFIDSNLAKNVSPSIVAVTHAARQKSYR